MKISSKFVENDKNLKWEPSVVNCSYKLSMARDLSEICINCEMGVWLLTPRAMDSCHELRLLIQEDVK